MSTLQPPINVIARDDLKQWIEQVISQPITSIHIDPLTSSDSASGVPLYRIEAQSDVGVHRFVVKIASPNGDWIARATRDDTVREAALFRAGLSDHLPPEIEWPVLATQQSSGDAWLILMSDLNSTPNARLVPPGDDSVNIAETTLHLTNLATLHRSFLGTESSVADVSLCQIGDWLTLLGPATIERERGGDDPVTPHLTRGWEAFRRLAPTNIANSVAALLYDPTSLTEALCRGSMTLLHGDFKYGNLGLYDRVPISTIALDWSQAMWGPPQLDLAWFLAVNSARLPFSKEDAITIYREALGVANDHTWQREMDIALFAGGVLRLGWAKALGATSDNPDIARREQAELDWWLSVAEAALLSFDLT